MRVFPRALRAAPRRTLPVGGGETLIGETRQLSSGPGLYAKPARARHLRALVVFDEVRGLLPPHPANPPTKRPTVALMKQGRAFRVGVIVATQNPMGLDYRTLSDAGFWAIGRLETDADHEARGASSDLERRAVRR